MGENVALHAIREAKALRKAMTAPFRYDTNDVTSIVHLSDAERFRLYRAFLRFELFCIVFRTPHRKKELVWYSERDPCRLFLDRFEPFEVEEVVCIYIYFRRLLFGTMCETHRLFLQAVRSISVREAAAATTQLGEASSSAAQQSGQPFNDVVELPTLHSTALEVFSPECKWVWDAWLGRVASLGLDFMFEFARRDRNRRFKILRSPFLWRLECTYVDLIVRFCLAGFRGPPLHYTSIPEDPRLVNTGYPVYIGVPLEGRKWYSYRAHQMSSPFRAIGLVFWDSDRIVSAPMRGAVAAARGNHFLRRYCYVDWADSYGYRGLYDIKLRKGHLKALERYFGLTRTL